VRGEDLNQCQEKLIDEAIKEIFLAIDPIAPKCITKEHAPARMSRQATRQPVKDTGYLPKARRQRWA